MQYLKVVEQSLQDFCVMVYEKYPYLPSVISQLQVIELASPKTKQALVISPLKSKFMEAELKDKSN